MREEEGPWCSGLSMQSCDSKDDDQRPDPQAVKLQMYSAESTLVPIKHKAFVNKLEKENIFLKAEIRRLMQQVGALAIYKQMADNEGVIEQNKARIAAAQKYRVCTVQIHLFCSCDFRPLSATMQLV